MSSVCVWCISHLPRKTNWIFIRVKVTSFHLESIWHCIHGKNNNEKNYHFQKLMWEFCVAFEFRTKQKLQLATPNASHIHHTLADWLYMAQQTKSNLNKKNIKFPNMMADNNGMHNNRHRQRCRSEATHTHAIYAENRHIIWSEWIVFPSMPNDVLRHSSRCMELCIGSKVLWRRSVAFAMCCRTFFSCTNCQ